MSPPTLKMCRKSLISRSGAHSRPTFAGCPENALAAILLRLRRAVSVAVRDTGSSVFNSQAANRRLAIRMVTGQFVVAMLVALAFLIAKGKPEAMAAAIG